MKTITKQQPKPTSPLKQRIRAKGLSQLDVAMKAGVCLNTVSLAVRSGQFTTEVGLRLAEALGCSIDDLVAPSNKER